MSYFDDNYNGGADGSDDDKNNSSGSDSETETNIDENEIDLEVDDDDVAEGKETDNESDEDDKGDEGKKIDYKKEYGVDFGSDDNEDIIEFARKNKEKLKAKYGEDFGNDEEEDIKIVRKYLAEQREKENEAVDDSENDSDSSVAPKKKTKKLPTKQKGPSVAAMLADEEDDDDDPTGEVYLQKFDKEINNNYLANFHPESAVHNYDEILVMTKVIRDKNGIIIDPLHKTIPYLTKYEKARVLGQRAKQINSGASVFVKVPEKVIDGYLIAELELIEKRIPFIIRRPLPNGGSEYWSIKDLENISF
jgi:DNA-directed RNA polymerase I, II, and III subunit RPABC2